LLWVGSSLRGHCWGQRPLFHARLEVTCLAVNAVGSIPIRIACVNSGGGKLGIELAGKKMLRDYF